MKEVLMFSKQATIDFYLFSEQFSKREHLVDNETMTIASMRYMPILDFDLSKLKGKKIKDAVLTLQVKGRDYPLEVEFTSISQAWNEDYVSYYHRDKDTPWINDEWFSDVIMSNGNSKYFREKTEYNPEDKTLKIHVPTELVYAMINQQSYGFGLLDCKSRGYGATKEEGWLVIKKFNINEKNGLCPQLEVDYCDWEYQVPEKACCFTGIASENPESFKYAGVTLNWTFNETNVDEYRYFNIYMSKKDERIENMESVGKYYVPNYDAEKNQVGTEIEYLQPNTTYWFAITISNGLYESEPVYTKVKTLGVRQLPTIDKADDCCNLNKGYKGVDKESYSISALDEVCKVNPLNGNIYEVNPEGYAAEDLCRASKYDNILFDGKCVKLNGVLGEKMAFQFILDNKGIAKNYSVKVKENDLGDSAVSLYKVWYLKCENGWYPEVAIPIGDSEGFSIPFVENKIPEQRFQSIFVDVKVPENATAGSHRFVVEFCSEGAVVSIPVEVIVYDLKLENPKFFFELNGYVATPIYMKRNYDDPEFSEIEEAYYRAAYEHNMTVNILPYSHFGSIQPGFNPKIEMINGIPRVTDWSQWDAHFEKYLDGSYLLDTTGKKVPVTHMYLPFHENWPMPINEYYKVKVDTEDYPEIVNEHKLKATSVKEDFMPEYREGIKAVIKDFIKHIDEKGWKDVEFQYFFNNKHFYKEKNFTEKHGVKGAAAWLIEVTCGNDGNGTSWWLLDEPHFRDDWEAIAFLGAILKEAQQEMNSGYNIKFRVDISCYNHLFNFLDGILDTAIVAGRPFDVMEDAARKRKAKFGEDYWVYGSLNAIDRSNLDSLLWVLDAYVKGGVGLVPWNNYAVEEEYEIPTQTAALYPGNRFGLKKPTVSLRLKAARKGLELLRYLETFKKTFGYSDLQMKAYVANFVKLKGEALVRFQDDAGEIQYVEENNYMNLEELKKDILQKLLVKKYK